MRLWGITTKFMGFIPQNLVLKSIVLGLISIQNIDCTLIPTADMTKIK